MHLFLMSVDEQFWLVVKTEWKSPVVNATNGSERLKSPPEWNDKEKQLAQGNSRVVNAMFAEVDKDNYRLISDYETGVAAQDILQITLEGTKKVKVSRLQMITTQLEA